MTESIDSKSISVSLINDYSPIADLHILVYGSAECAITSPKCTKVKLLILNNFDQDIIEKFIFKSQNILLQFFFSTKKIFINMKYV